MIRHIVLVRFASHTDATEIAAIFADLTRLRDVVPGVRAFAAGASVSPEGLGQGYGYGFTFDFNDEAARDAYLIHPAHQAAGARLVKAADGGTDGLVVLDIAV